MIIRVSRFAGIFILLLTVILPACKKTGMQQVIPIPIVVKEFPVLKPNVVKINEVIGGFYSALPPHYQETSKKYPLLIFIHGGGQFGNGNNDLPMLLSEAVPELLDEKIFPAAFNVKGENFSFIVLAPQFSRQPVSSQVDSFVSYAIENYRVDTSRIYLSGFSNGGKITCDVSAEFPSRFAAIVPIAGVSDTGDVSEKCRRLAEANMPIWVFHNDKDLVIKVEESKTFISLINGFNPVIAPRYTEFPAMGLLGHDAWTRATNPDYKENGMNIYEWMLQFRR